MAKNKGKEKYHYINSISKRIGQVFLWVGILIFAIWFVSRYFLAYDFDWLELLGLYWLTVGFYICSFALILWFVYFLRNMYYGDRTCYSALPWLLINLPASVAIVLFVFSDFVYTYIGINNRSDTQLNYYIVNSKDTLAQGQLSTVFYNVARIEYAPFLKESRRERNPLYLILEEGELQKKIELTKVGRGGCRQYSIAPGLELEQEK